MLRPGSFTSEIETSASKYGVLFLSMCLYVICPTMYSNSTRHLALSIPLNLDKEGKWYSNIIVSRNLKFEAGFGSY